jgi:hypothetical protein
VKAKQRRQRIFNVLKATLSDKRANVHIDPTSGAPKTVTVAGLPDREHTIKVRLTWEDDGEPHYRGYFMDVKGKKSQAIVSLYNQFDAAQFIVAMNLLGDLSAKSKDH